MPPARAILMSGSRPVLRGAAAMWAVAAELGAIYVLSNLPTPLYVIYRQAFGFSQLTLTVIYAVYVVGTIATHVVPVLEAGLLLALVVVSARRLTTRTRALA